MDLCVIGNGPSNRLYHKNKNEYDLIIGCNIPQHNFECDVISLVDEKPLEIIESSRVDLGQIWCPENLYKISNLKKLPGNWNPIYEMKGINLEVGGQMRKAFYNSGLASIDYVCENYNDLQEIHLWGFDSMFGENFNSQMDRLIIRPPKNIPLLTKVWNGFWKEVLDKYPNIKFKSHLPLGENLKEPFNSFTNVIPVHHSD